MADTYNIIKRTSSDLVRLCESAVVSTPTDTDIYQLIRIPPHTFVDEIILEVTTLDADGVVGIGYGGAAGTDADAFMSAAVTSAVGTQSSKTDDAVNAAGKHFTNKGAVLTATTTCATAVFKVYMKYFTLY